MRFEIIVVPNSKKPGISEDNLLKVRVKAKPENNKANLEVEKLLSKHFGRKARIVSGFKSHRKIIELDEY